MPLETTPASDFIICYVKTLSSISSADTLPVKSSHRTHYPFLKFSDKSVPFKPLETTPITFISSDEALPCHWTFPRFIGFAPAAFQQSLCHGDSQ